MGTAVAAFPRPVCYVASYTVNKRALEHTHRLIDARQYVLDSDWGEVQPSADDENAYLASTPGTTTPRGTSG